MSESKDIRKLEIPENIKKEYIEKLHDEYSSSSLNFWGSFINWLLEEIILYKKTLGEKNKEIKSLENELEIRTGEYKHNKVTEGIEALQDAGFSVELHFRERKNG
jgi:hypothetical protein